MSEALGKDPEGFPALAGLAPAAAEAAWEIVWERAAETGSWASGKMASTPQETTKETRRPAMPARTRLAKPSTPCSERKREASQAAMKYAMVDRMKEAMGE